MLNQEFLQLLENKICKIFEQLNDTELKGFWCDGIILDLPEAHYIQKFINDKRQTSGKAFIGKDGQTEFELTLKFGEKSLSKLARTLPITDCFSTNDPQTWFHIDLKEKKLEIQLD